MGCAASEPVVKVAAQRTRTTRVAGKLWPSPVADISPFERFDMIVNGATQIIGPSHMMPIVCLSPDAFPVITSPIQVEDTPSNVHLPIIAGSIKEHGRLMAFSQLQFLFDPAFKSPGTSAVMAGSFTWLAGGPMQKSVVLAGFDKATTSLIQASLGQLSFVAYAVTLLADFSDYSVVVIPSDVDFEADALAIRLYDYVCEGGGLAIFLRHKSEPRFPLPVNEFLIEFGLSFTVCLLNSNQRNPQAIPVPASFSFVRDCWFGAIINSFKETLDQSHVDATVLDELVTTLRYYIMVCDRSYVDCLVDIAHSAWDYLRRTHYATDGGFCPELEQGIVVVLLQELYTNMPIARSPPIAELSVFPGVTGPVQLEDVTLTLSVCPEGWVSTGLWLPANSGARLLIPQVYDHMSLQVGSHCESLLVQQGPWSRWPAITSTFELSKTEQEIGSVFGGILYVIWNPTVPADSKSVTVTLKQVCKHPRFLHTDGSLWQHTKDIQVPWGEIDLGKIIFTLPSNDMRRIHDCLDLKRRYDKMIAHIIWFTNYNPKFPYRIVFDIQLPDDGPASSYPSVLLLDDIDGVIFDVAKPNMALFKALSLIALISIQDYCFDVDLETAIASVAAAVTFKEVFPNFDPFQFPGMITPPLFAEFWTLHQQFNKDLFPSLIAVFQDSSYQVGDAPDDMWIAFVKEMSHIGKRNFAPLFSKVKPLPHMSQSVLALPSYP
jgi:hypothetical protein